MSTCVSKCRRQLCQSLHFECQNCNVWTLFNFSYTMVKKAKNGLVNFKTIMSIMPTKLFHRFWGFFGINMLKFQCPLIFFHIGHGRGRSRPLISTLCTPLLILQLQIRALCFSMQVYLGLCKGKNSKFAKLKLH